MAGATDQRHVAQLVVLEFSLDGPYAAEAIFRLRSEVVRGKLRAAREPRWSREELGRRTVISAAEIESVETGRIVAPGFFVVADLARELGLKLDELDRASRRKGGKR